MKLLGTYYYWLPRYERENHTTILDPDGWDRRDPESFNEAITYEEFCRRALWCTQMFTVGRYK